MGEGEKERYRSLPSSRQSLREPSQKKKKKGTASQVKPPPPAPVSQTREGGVRKKKKEEKKEGEKGGGVCKRALMKDNHRPIARASDRDRGKGEKEKRRNTTSCRSEKLEYGRMPLQETGEKKEKGERKKEGKKNPQGPFTLPKDSRKET